MPRKNYDVLEKLEEKAEKALKNSDEVDEIVHQLLTVRDELNKNVTAIKARMNKPLSKFDIEASFVFSKVDVKQYYIGILLREMNKAIVQTKEYDLPIFRTRLVQAITAPGTLQIKVEGPDRIRVSILPGLRKNAGTLDEWLSAVKKTRAELQIKKRGKGQPQGGPAGGIAGSDMYEEKIYKPAREGGHVQRDYGRYTKDVTEKFNKKYFETLKSRLSHVTSLAPWWEYLEYGSDHGPATAGGRAYPHFAGTHFVAISTMRIIEHLKGRLYFLKRNRDSELRLELDVYSELLYRVEETLNKLKTVRVYSLVDEVNTVARVVNGAIGAWFKVIRTGKYTGRKLSIQGQMEATRRLKHLFLESIKRGELTSVRMRGQYKGEIIETRTIAMWNDFIVPNLKQLGITVGKVRL